MRIKKKKKKKTVLLCTWSLDLDKLLSGLVQEGEALESLRHHSVQTKHMVDEVGILHT